ncbi:MAG: aldolase/citrate lyase family protein [Acidobacteria bacterium]|nr:aldolase/citrate lyase family protein [Acidobacteriota bacterium]
MQPSVPLLDRRRRPAGLTFLAIGVVLLAPLRGQDAPRLNRVIEQVERNEAAFTNQHWQFIDMEHGPYLLDRLQTRLADLKPDGEARPTQTPLVRIPMEGGEPVRFAVKQVLDMGAFGVVFPRVETREQAGRAVQAMRYPPQRGEVEPDPPGLRGWGPGRAARYWGLSVPDYVPRADVWPLDPDGELLALIMIESATGVANVEEIVTVPGIGALFIGPADLAMSLGVGPPGPEHAPETEEAIQTVLRACLDAGVTCGIAESKTRAEQRIAEGFRVLLAF